MAAKKTWELIPMCHMINLGSCKIDFESKEETLEIYCTCSVKTVGKTGAEMEYTLVGDHEANLAEGKLSVETPIGHALLGHKKGDKVEVQVPVGLMEFEILNISI